MDFSGPIEAALSTDLRSAPYNFSLWDIYTGTQLVLFKGIANNTIPKCLQFIDNNYFMTANDNVLHVWSIFNRKCQDQKLFLPSRPSTLCISPCGNYLIAGIGEMIFIWQLHSGNLLANVQRHYQTISVLKMNQEGNILISGGEDGLALVWSFADLISTTCNTASLNLDKTRKDFGINEPRFSWQNHNSQITDLTLTNGGRCVTASVDKTLNIYSYITGQRLFNVILPSPIWSVVVDKNETKIFAGAQSGDIYEVAISNLATINSVSESDSEAMKPIFTGHKGKVLSLIVSTDGARLVSASVDSSCKIWDVQQRKMLQDVKHQAPLANLTSLLVPDALALTSMSQSSSTNQALIFKPLKRNLYKQPRVAVVMCDELFEDSATTIIWTRNKVDHTNYINLKPPSEIKCGKQILANLEDIRKQQLITRVDLEPKEEAIETLTNLKQKIRNLYLLSARKIFKNASEESLRPYKNLVDNLTEYQTDDKVINGKKISKKKKRAMTGEDDKFAQFNKVGTARELAKSNRRAKKLKADSEPDIFV